MAKGNVSLAMNPDEEWRVEQDMRTLMDAKAIHADPKRMAKVKAMASKKLEDLACVVGDVANNETK